MQLSDNNQNESNGHNVSQSKRSGRVIKISSLLKESNVESTIGHKETVEKDEDLHRKIYLPIISSISDEINTRFAELNLSIKQSITAFDPLSKDFLDYETA